MATARFATVTSTAAFGADTHLLELALPEGAEPLGFSGGQYVIVDTGLVGSTGKAVKRAYSILSGDAEQQRFSLAVKRLPSGPGSGYLAGLQPGAEVKFSGPWGKLAPAPILGPVLVLATDTGITAALGLVRGAAMRPHLAATELVWLRTEADYFLPDRIVTESLPSGLGRFSVGAVPPIGHPERIPHARAGLRDRLTRGVTQAFVMGDGAVNYALLDDLVAAGIPATRDSVESFFNMPKKSA